MKIKLAEIEINKVGKNEKNFHISSYKPNFETSQISNSPKYHTSNTPL